MAQHGKLLSGSHSRWEATGLKHYSAGDILYHLTNVEMSPESSLAGRLQILPDDEIDQAVIPPAKPVLEQDEVAEDYSFLAGISAKEAIRVISDVTTLHGAESALLWESDTTEGGKNRPTVIAAIQAKIEALSPIIE